MNKLSTKELDLLSRIEAEPKLQPFFFRKIKGLKWFDALDEAGYFNAENVPKPIPTEQEGYVRIHRWEIGEYLIKTALELTGKTGSEYAPRFLKIISDATTYAQENSFENYRVWLQFTQIISTIPSRLVCKEFLDVVDYWLGDTFERNIVAGEIAEKWLVKLLEEGSDHAFELAPKLLDILYKVKIVEQATGEIKKHKALLRFAYSAPDRITKKVAFLSGCKLGPQAISVFHSKLEETLEALDNDSWSYVWQPAIEEHDQNNLDNTENLLVQAYRDCLRGYFEYCPEEACAYIAEIMESPFQTIRRLSIHCIAHQFSVCKKYTERLIDQKFFDESYRHEMWHFINCNYPCFDPDQKKKIIELIKDRKQFNGEGNLLEGATAYEQTIWFAAIKDHDEQGRLLYDQAVFITGTEPDHPDFSSYMSTGTWIGQESPYSVDELGMLTIDKLVQTLKTTREEGLVETFKQLIKTSPSRYYLDFAKFTDLDLSYVNAIIKAYKDLCNEKANLPWSDIWPCLLKFCSTVVYTEQFWNEETSQYHNASVAKRHCVVSAIGGLLESGAKSDEHGFHEDIHKEVELLIACLLKKERGVEFKEKNDIAFTAMNSPRGWCIIALITLTLRSCRLSDQTNNDHSKVWERFQSCYDDELKRADDSGKFEFYALVTMYLPNFLYMSREWVLSNLKMIFDQGNPLKWTCAMEGYYYVRTLYTEVYKHLKEHGDFLKALDNENIENRAKGRVLEHIAVAYLKDLESLEDNNSLIRVLIDRKKFQELDNIISFVLRLKKEDLSNLKDKVYELWPLLKNVADSSTREGRMLASSLCRWAIFVDHLDNDRKELLLEIAPYSDELYNSHALLQSIADLSNNRPFEANEIWLKMLERSAPDYPEEAIRQILSNLVSQGEKGNRTAEKTVDEYIKRGVASPSKLLKEVKKS